MAIANKPNVPCDFIYKTRKVRPPVPIYFIETYEWDTDPATQAFLRSYSDVGKPPPWPSEFARKTQCASWPSSLVSSPLCQPVVEPANGTLTGNGVASTKPQLLLSEGIKQYSEYCASRRRGGWSANTREQHLAIYNVLLEIVGDQPVTEVTDKTAACFADTIERLPANRKKTARYRDSSIDTILKMQGVRPMEVGTYNKYIQRAESLYNWLVDRGHVTRNPFKDLRRAPIARPDQQRDAFDTDDLQKLFTGSAFISVIRGRKRYFHYRFWLPLLALFTGARLEELAGLSLDDVLAADDIPYLRVHETSDRRLKNSYSNRMIPLHPKLIELGFLRYVDFSRQHNQARLFWELPKMKKGYGKECSEWFSEYRRECGIQAEDRKKVFHSFRHTFANNLREHGSKDVLPALLGHSTGKISEDRYCKAYPLAKLYKDGVLKLNFDVDWAPLSEAANNPYLKTSKRT